MRRLLLLMGVLLLGLVVACGGGSDDTDPSATSQSGGSGGSGNSGGSGGSGGSSGGSGADSDFCSPDQADAIFNSFNLSSSADLKNQFSTLDDNLDQWSKSAPNEIKDDVKTLSEGIRGLIELMDEYDYDFIAIGTNAANDPRFLALDTEEFQAASDRISEFCGIDVDSGFSSGGSGASGGSTGGSSGGSSGGASGGFGVALPDDFPEDLVPPDSEPQSVVNIGIGTSAEFTSSATLKEVSDYYQDALGDPTYSDASERLWSVLDGTKVTTVQVTGEDGAVEILISIISG